MRKTEIRCNGRVPEREITMEVWLLQYGRNADGKLFLGDKFSGGNAQDTPQNREMLVRDFCRETGREMPIMSAAGTPIKFDGTIVEFSRIWKLTK